MSSFSRAPAAPWEKHRRKGGPMRVLFIAVCLGYSPALLAQDEPASSPFAEHDALLTRLRQPPDTPELVAELTKLVTQRIARLEQAVERETDTEARAAWHELIQQWKDFAAVLTRISERYAGIAGLSSEAQVQKVADEVAAIRQETAALRSRRLELPVSEERLQTARAGMEALQLRIRTLTEAQAGRAERLATGFATQRKDIESQLAERRRERAALVDPAAEAPPVEPAPSPSPPRAVDVERLEIRIATAEASLRALNLAEQETELQRRQAQQIIEVLRAQADLLQGRLTEMESAQSLSRLEVLERQRAQAVTAVERALLELRLFHERTLLSVARLADRQPVATGRTGPGVADRIKERIGFSHAFWQRSLASLEFRGATDAEVLHNQLDDERREFSTTLAEARRELAGVLTELRAIQRVRAQSARRFQALTERLVADLGPEETADRTRIENEATTLRSTFDQSLGKTAGQLDEQAARLAEAVDALADHAAFLDTMVRQLKWKRVTSRSDHLFNVNAAAVREELRTLFATVIDPPMFTATGLDTADVAAETEGATPFLPLFDDARAALSSLTASERLRIAAGPILLTALAFVVYRVSRRKGVRLAHDIREVARQLEAETQTPGSGISMRFNLLGWNMLGDLAIPTALAGGLMLGVLQAFDDPTLRRMALVVLGLTLATLGSMRLVHHLFEAEGRALRPVRCDDAVARHYRRWLKSLAVLSLVMWLPMTLLHVHRQAPLVSRALLDSYQAGFLVLLFLFLLRRERVFGRPESFHQGGARMLAYFLQPLLLTAVVTLLVLEVAGYGPIVTYVGGGALLTLGVATAIGAVSEYLVDMLQLSIRPDAQPHLTPPAAHVAVAHPPEGAQPSFVAYLLTWLIRLSAVAALVWTTARIWGVSLELNEGAWRTFGLMGIVVLLAFVLDRTASTALATLQRLDRLPESTTRIARRWFRGLLILLATLACVAIAGFQVESVWSFITTALALVAVGFVAVWSILSNILATFVILIWRPFYVGERIELVPDGVAGRVIDINFIYTILRTDEGERISVPNNMFAQKFIRRQGASPRPSRSLAEQLESDAPLQA